MALQTKEKKSEHKLSAEIVLNDLRCTEQKHYRDYIKRIEFTFLKSDLPFVSEHGIHDLIIDNVRIVPQVVTEKGVRLSIEDGTLAVKIDKDHITIATDLTCELIDGYIVLHFQKENDFEIARSVLKERIIL